MILKYFVHVGTADNSSLVWSIHKNFTLIGGFNPSCVNENAILLDKEVDLFLILEICGSLFSQFSIRFILIKTSFSMKSYKVTFMFHSTINIVGI